MLILVAHFFGRTIQFPMTDDLNEITVGTLPDNVICLPYKGISRRHFSLVRKENSWFLQDKGSTNGTRLNGMKVQESVVNAGDVIHVGIVELKLVEAEEGNLVNIPKQQTLKDRSTHTDKLSNVEGSLKESLFESNKVVFPPGTIPGKSERMMEIYQKVHLLADSDVSVLLIGETGTGKEMFARMLQLSGKRSSAPFIAVNCAAIPSELFEAELFGIGQKVATDVQSRKGKIEMADGGTLFLDELSAFPMALQAKVLRAIEEKAITPVGEHRQLAVDFRLISATNEDPQELIRSGKLREDLYHRVAAVEIAIPPLRERSEDIPILVLGLLQQISKKEKKPVAGISKKLLSVLSRYPYPGNIRELVNLINSMIALAHPGEMIDMHLVPAKLLQPGIEEPEPLLSTSEQPVDLHGKLDELSKTLILRALHQHNWNMTAAAKSLGITRFGLRKMMKRLAISAKEK